MPRGIYKRTPEMRVGKWKRTEEHNKRTRIRFKKLWQKVKDGKIPDIFHPEGWGEKVSQTLKKRWDKIGRRTYKSYQHPNGFNYKNWRKNVFERDNYICWICEKKGDKLQAHHLKSWIKYPKLRLKIWNGMTLCEWCHKTYTKFQLKGRRA